MKLLGFYIFSILLSFLYSGTADHLIFNKICVNPDEAEFIEIYNPTSESIDLSNYYLSDSEKYYQWINGESISGFDFLIKFPTGTSIEPEEVYTVTTQSSVDFYNFYNYEPDISLVDTDFEIFEFGLNPNLSNSQEVLILFYWDGVTSIVQDVDYFLWGGDSRAVSKTVEEGYPFNDTLTEDQIFIRNYSLAAFSDSLYVRKCTNEFNELEANGNGITGDDETSENLVSSWFVEGVTQDISFQDITNGDYDCIGESSQDGCPLGNLSDCPIVNPTGIIVDYFDITPYGGPHALTIEDGAGYRLELTIWPDEWDIVNDTEYSYLLEPPYNTTVVQAFGNVFEYQGEKQILICSPDVFNIIGPVQDEDVDFGEGIIEDFDDIDGDNIFDTEITNEPYTDLNQNGQWDNDYQFCDFCIGEIELGCIDDSFTNAEDCYEQGRCSNPIFLDEEACINECEQWILGQWHTYEPYEDLNQNGEYDEGFEQPYDFLKANISPAPFVLIPSSYEVLDYSYSFPSNSRVIIRVFDISGRFITTLVDKYYESSGIVKREQSASSWDGTNEIGQVQPPGTYLMHMEASNFQTGQTSTDIAPVVIGIKK